MRWLRLFFAALFIVVVLLASLLVSGPTPPIEKDLYELELGISFSPPYAKSLGLDPQETYRAILDTFDFPTTRLPVYWSEVEKEDDLFDFAELDWYLREAGRRKLRIVLTVGYRNFRFPECHPPEWAKDLDDKTFETELFEYLLTVVNHFVGGGFDQTIEAWQVENEPFDLPIFRRWCRHFSSSLVARELEAVKEADPKSRPVVLTSGGEIFLRILWEEAISRADILGVSFYPRTVLPGGLVVQTYRLGPLSPRNIIRERQFAHNLGKEFWVVEMQAEPWGGKAETMSPEILKENYELLLEFGGAERIYLWGAEWWYSKLKEGDPSMWNVAKEIINP